jgi:aspartate/methionine/tyrosine aminotransferase
MIDLGLGHLRIFDEIDERSVPFAGREYTPPGGMVALREAIAEYERVSASEVAVTTGASMALVSTLATLRRPGRVLCPRPHFPAYPRMAAMLGFDVSYYDMHAENGWLPDPAELRALLTPDVRAIFWNFPGNPTGAVCSTDLLHELAAVVGDRDVTIVSDEVYASLSFDDADVRTDPTDVFGRTRVVRVMSFSKAFQIPGERLGYVIAGADRAIAIARAHWELAMSPPATGQALALTLLRDDPEGHVRTVRKIVHERRDLAIDVVRRFPRLRWTEPRAGIFLWIEIVDCDVDAPTFASQCRDDGVIVVPGTAFGVSDRVFFRASYGVPREEIENGFARVGSIAEAL